jgi:uncharacterized membrane protein
MITIHWVYAVAGAAFVAFAALSLRDRRWSNSAFWALLAGSMWGGDLLGNLGNGVLVLALVAVAGTGRLAPAASSKVTAELRAERAARFGNGLFLLALIIALTALAGTLLFKALPALVDSKQVTLVSLALGVLIALVAGYAWLRPPALEPLDEGRRLMDTIGWAALLPQMLASLGAVFALAGVGDVVGSLIQQAIPEGSLFAAVVAFGLGMALFTMVMGNSFAAFPVMTAAIGLPVLVHQYHGNPAVVCAIGMLAGFCGTLMTPMAANFNLVPAGLLELKDRYGVIRAQIPTALPLLAINILFIYWFAFP